MSGQSNIIASLGDDVISELEPWANLATAVIDASPDPEIRVFQARGSDCNAIATAFQLSSACAQCCSRSS